MLDALLNVIAHNLLFTSSFSRRAAAKGIAYKNDGPALDFL